MIVEYRKTFLKELALIPAQIRNNIENFAFEELPKINALSQSGKIEKMKGYSSYFKARFGNYRVGIKTEKGKVILERVLHRKEIYRFFP
ncbi:MAG: type II toxin-antitoxin system RelE family toxin [Ignavibacteriaceae bacterium]